MYILIPNSTRTKKTKKTYLQWEVKSELTIAGEIFRRKFNRSLYGGGPKENLKKSIFRRGERI